MTHIKPLKAVNDSYMEHEIESHIETMRQEVREARDEIMSFMRNSCQFNFTFGQVMTASMIESPTKGAIYMIAYGGLREDGFIDEHYNGTVLTLTPRAYLYGSETS